MTKNLAITSALLFTLILQPVVAAERTWEDSSLPRAERIAALLDAMTVEEKMAQLLADAPGIPRLGIKPYNWWNEALHGVARNGRATVFPQTIGLAATFDEDLVHRVATAISDEARAKFNIAQAMGNYSRYAGLTFWSPNINIFRDPRWGRGMETYGEDPFLQARLGTAFVRGLQGDDERHMKAAACAKHYAVHSGPEANRHEFDAVVSKRDLNETYLPAFEALVREGGVECVMCAYNRVDGAPACGSDMLLRDILRDDWGFEGHVVSDCGAIDDFHEHHKVAKDAAESAAWALKAGTDVNCGDAYADLPEALARGLIDETDVDRALTRLLATRLKLGFFDGGTAWDALDDSMVERETHVALAREAARRTVVLLKNEGGILPLKKDLRTLYVTGPGAANSEVLLGNYYGVSSDMVSILDGIVGKVSAGTSVNYRQGVLPYRENVNPMDWATGLAHTSEATIAVMGISGLLEGEEGASIASPHKGDRLELDLPASQRDYLRRLREDNDRPLIVVLTGGSPMTIPEVHELADAVVFAWYPGQQGGNAVADVLFGDANPSGRLPITFPRSVEQLPPYEDYAMRGRTYKYMTEEPLYPFGYGLSYTTFAYGEPRLADGDAAADPSLTIEVEVRNTGTLDGVEIVQVYHRVHDAPFEVPQATLVGFRPVSIPAGENRTVEFDIPAERLRAFDEEGRAVRVTGRHELLVGGVSPGERGAELTGQELRKVEFTLR
jgi:beta-glucosidase